MYKYALETSSSSGECDFCEDGAGKGRSKKRPLAAIEKASRQKNDEVAGVLHAGRCFGLQPSSVSHNTT